MYAAIRRIILFHIDFNKIEHKMNGITYECTIIHKKRLNKITIYCFIYYAITNSELTINSEWQGGQAIGQQLQRGCTIYYEHKQKILIIIIIAIT